MLSDPEVLLSCDEEECVLPKGHESSPATIMLREQTSFLGPLFVYYSSSPFWNLFAKYSNDAQGPQIPLALRVE